MSQPSLFQAIVTGKCPHCRTGAFFIFPFWQVKKYAKMHSHCPHCGQDLEPEPGFYFGAMYMSYGLTTGIVLVSTVLLFLLMEKPPIAILVGLPTIVILAAFPFVYRAARVLYFYAFSGVKFKG